MQLSNTETALAGELKHQADLFVRAFKVFGNSRAGQGSNEVSLSSLEVPGLDGLTLSGRAHFDDQGELRRLEVQKVYRREITDLLVSVSEYDGFTEIKEKNQTQQGAYSVTKRGLYRPSGEAINYSENCSPGRAFMRFRKVN